MDRTLRIAEAAAFIYFAVTLMVATNVSNIPEAIASVALLLFACSLLVGEEKQS
mgnify:CR=1 FL=1